jgi:hypothetical protein
MKKSPSPNRAASTPVGSPKKASPSASPGTASLIATSPIDSSPTGAGGGPAGIVGDERLSFTFQFVSLTIRVPETPPAETEYYLKWVRGRSFKGKLPPVYCPLDTPREEDALVVVKLPPTHQFNFEVTLHPKAKDGSVFEKKMMEILIIERHYSDCTKSALKGRKNVAEIKVDLRTLLRSARVGVKSKVQFPISDDNSCEFLEAMYTVVPLDGERAGGGAGPVVPKRGTLLQAPLKPIAVSGTEKVLDIIDSCINETIWENGLKGEREDWVPLADVMASELYRSIDTPRPLEETWTLLFGASQYKEALHNVRGDRGYIDPGWTQTSDNSSGWSIVSYQVRLGEDKYLQSNEKSVYCAAGREIIARSFTTVPSAPLIGDCSHMEYVFHLYENENGGGTVVAMFGYMIITSSTARALADSRVKKNINKVLDVSVEVVQSLLGANSRNSTDGRSTARESKYRRSLTYRPGVISASLEPNLWLRMADRNTLPHVHLVHQYLKRLQETNPANAKVARERVVILENIVVYHRQVVPIVKSCCELLQILSLNLTPQVIYQCSATLGATLRSVFDLHKAEPEFAEFEPMIQSLEQEHDAAVNSKKAGLAKERNFWELLEKQAGDAEIVDMCLEEVKNSTCMLMPGHIDSLARVLSLHLANEAIVNMTMQILVKGRLTNPDLKFTEDLIQAIHGAFRVFPSLWNRYPDLMRTAKTERKQLTPFERRFGHLVPEPVVYQCRILRYQPKMRTGILYLTRNYLVIDQTVLNFSNIVSIVQKWKMLQPLVEVTVRQSRASLRNSNSNGTSCFFELDAPAPDKKESPRSGTPSTNLSASFTRRTETTTTVYQFSVWSRKELLQEIANQGYVSLLHQTEKE